ncbi:unnamed protein product [Closterium sp. NIES-54]
MLARCWTGGIPPAAILEAPLEAPVKVAMLPRRWSGGTPPAAPRHTAAAAAAAAAQCWDPHASHLRVGKQ